MYIFVQCYIVYSGLLVKIVSADSTLCTLPFERSLHLIELAGGEFNFHLQGFYLLLVRFHCIFFLLNVVICYLNILINLFNLSLDLLSLLLQVLPLLQKTLWLLFELIEFISFLLTWCR